MKKTLSLTGLTINAMALIAPGAFLWLTFELQAAQVAPGRSLNSSRHMDRPVLSVGIIFLNRCFVLLAKPPLPRRWRRQLILLCPTSIT